MQINGTPETAEKVVNIENSIFKSFQGKYFLGQSNLLSFGYDGYAYGVLYNPPNSGVILYVSVITISNTSNIPVKSRIYLNANIPGGSTAVTAVTPSNLAVSPLPVPMVNFLVGQFVTGEVTGGVKAFTRMVSPSYTLVMEKDGKIVIPPGGNILTSLVPPEDQLVKADIAYGWWEEKI